MWTTHYGDYDHLARVKEWAASGGESEYEIRVGSHDGEPQNPAGAARIASPRRRSGCVGVRLRQCRLRQDLRADPARHQPAAARRRSGEDPLHHLYEGGRRQHGEPRVRHAGAMDHAGRCRASTSASRKPSAASRPRGSARWRAGCLPPRSRRRAASRCRPSTPSARGCCTSFRSRPTSPRASRCSTKAPTAQLLERLTLEVMLEASRTAGRRAWPGAGDRHHVRGRHDLQGGDRRDDPQTRRGQQLGEPRRRRPKAIDELTRAFGLDAGRHAWKRLKLITFGHADPGGRMAGAGRGARGQRQGHRERADRAHREARAARRRRERRKAYLRHVLHHRTEPRAKTC